MATINLSEVQEAADGRKLVLVVFSPQVPNPASQSDVEVIFEYQQVQAAHLDGEPFAIIGPLSCTLADTREPYVMSKPQRQAVVEAALIAVAEAHG